VAYAFSRKEEETEGSLCVISILQYDWVEEEMIEWKQYQEVCKVIQQLQEDPSSSGNFLWKNCFLWYHDHLYLCENSQLKHKVLLELHTSPIGGHSKFLKMYHKVKKYFSRKVLKLMFKFFCLKV
jgi:hypothetical protein